MKIGIIVATERERKAFYEVFGQPTLYKLGLYMFDVALWRITPDKFVYLILGGLGEIASASSTQYLIDNFGVDMVINYGVAGGLSEKHDARKVGIVKEVVHYGFDISFGSHYKVGEYPHQGIFLKPVRDAIPTSFTKDLDRFVCASADIIVAGGEPKRKLKREFGADICEMEAAGILITCNRNNIPCTLIKAISDGVDEDVEAFEQHVHAASKACVEVIADFIKRAAF